MPVQFSFDFSKIWNILIKVISSPSFITLIAPFLITLLGRFFPGLDPSIIKGLIELIVMILPVVFNVEMWGRYAFARLERTAQIKAGWVPDAAGKMTAPGVAP